MAAGTQVLLYGDSLLLAGIGAHLEAHADANRLFELVRMEAGCACLPHAMESGGLRILLFDLAATSPDSAVALLRTHPDLVVIGVDPSSEEMLVLTCRSRAVSSVTDLVEFIRQSACVSRHFSADGERGI